MKTLQYERVLMTPTLATELLKGNHGNRNTRQTHVQYLAESMRRGEWKLTHQGVAVSEFGRLLDGQHRLLAVVESGVTVPMMLARNVDEASFVYLDQGIGRSLTDSMGIKATHAEIFRFMARINRPDFHKPTAEMVLECRNVFNAAVDELESVACNRVKNITSAAIRSAVVLLFVEGYNVIEEYHQMTLLNLDKLRPNSIVFVKACIKGTYNKTSARLLPFCMALKALDPRTPQKQLLKLEADYADEAQARVRAALLKQY